MPLSLGPFKVYAVIYGLSLLAHIILAQRWCQRMTLPRRVGFVLSMCYMVGMAVGARLLYDVLNHQFNPANYLRPGYYFSDGLWGGPLAYLMLAAGFAWWMGGREWCIKMHPAPGAGGRRQAAYDPSASLLGKGGGILDVMVLALPIPMAIAKVACLFNGCCFGTPCDWPWCVVYPYLAEPPAGIARHPTQIYEIAALMFIYVVLFTLERRRWHGLLSLWFVFFYGLARPITEFFRVPGERRPTIGFLSTSQAICLAGAAVALIALYALRPPRRAFEPPVIRPAFA